MNETSMTETTQMRAPARQSGLGIASLVLGIIVIIGTAVMVAAAGAMTAAAGGALDPHSPQAILVGLGIMLFILVALIGIGLGIASVVQKKRKRVLGAVGLVLNALIVLSVALLMIVGLAAKNGSL